MSIILLEKYSYDEVSYFIDFITNNIEKYKLSKLTNDNCGDIPSINDTHPLAMEYGNLIADGTENYTSILPAIGIELVSDNEDTPNLLGKGSGVIEFTQALHDEISAIPLVDRYKQGWLIADETLAEIQAAINAKGGEKLYAKVDSEMLSQTVNVSIWSEDSILTRYVYLVVRSLLHKAKVSGSSVGLKKMSVNGEMGLYNYDFSKTLHGAEFNVNFIQKTISYEIDTDIVEITKVEHVAKTGIPTNANYAGVTGVGKETS